MNPSMSSRARFWLPLSLLAVVALAVGVLLYLNLSTPRQRTITISRPEREVRTAAEARKALDARIAAYKQAGEPILLADFVERKVDPARNFAEPVISAAKIFDKTDKDPFWNVDVSSNLKVEQWKIVDAGLDRFAPALALMDQAQTRDGVNWGIEFKSPAIGILLRSLNGARALANVLQAAALSAHHHSRDDQAIHRCAQLLILGRKVDEQPFLVSHLVSLSITSMSAQALADIVPTLRIGGGEGDASPQQVRQLIAALSDDQWLSAGFARSFMAERMSVVDTVNALIEHRLDPAQLSAMTTGKKPAAPEPLPSEAELLSDAGMMLDRLTQVVAAARSPRLSDFRIKAPASAPTLHTGIMNMLQSATFERAAIAHYSDLARLRLAAVALAARCWMAEHDGQPPSSLDALVPTYLASIPDDPLSASSAPAKLLYHPATTRPAAVASASVGLPARGGKPAAELSVSLTAASH